MKVGLLESQAARLNAYWAAYLRELGVQVVTPALPPEGALDLGRQSLPAEPLTVQLALGRILALGRVDAALVPQLGAVTGDAWGEALTDLLPRRISGLPALIAVPDDAEALDSAGLGSTGLGSTSLEGAATELGLRLAPNSGRVRLALERARPLAHGPRVDMPPLSRASRASVAVIGPRALLAEDALAGGLRPALEGLGLHPIFSCDLPPAEVFQRAARMESAAKVPAGERELFGALSLLAGKSAVRGVIFACPARDGATAAAAGRLGRKLHKPALHLNIEGGQTDFPELEAFRDRVTLGEFPQDALKDEQTSPDPRGAEEQA